MNAAAEFEAREAAVRAEALAEVEAVRARAEKMRAEDKQVSPNGIAICGKCIHVKSTLRSD